MTTACNLSDRHCVPCEGGIDPINRTTAEEMLHEISEWTLSEDGKSISRDFQFKGFFRTMGFVNAIAWIANTENHHPDFLTGYNHCEVTFTTHAIDGLSDNDFICAARVDALLDR